MSPWSSKICTNVSSPQVTKTDFEGWHAKEFNDLEWADSSTTSYPEGEITLTDPLTKPAM